MKKLYAIYAILCGCMCLAACSDSEYAEMTDRTIRLSAVVDEVKLMPQGSRNSIAVPPDYHDFTAAIWLSLTSGEYPAQLPDDATAEERQLSAETNIPLRCAINFQSGNSAFPDLADADKPRYPTDDKEVYCVGFYPNSGWDTKEDDAKVAARQITGYDDLMFAPEITGSWNNHFGDYRFRHLLTWLKVCVCTTTPEAASYWGKLKSITLKEMPDSLYVNLAKPETGDSYQLSDAVTPSVTTSDRTIFENQEGHGLGITIQDVASVFCYPSQTYKLSIVCENAVTKDVEIRLNSSDAALSAFPAGLQYVLVLYFLPFNVVEGVCTLKEWNAQNEDLYPDANS